MALVLALSVCVLPIPVETVITVDAMADDPIDAAVAPHYDRVIYLLTEPAYSTNCDARGAFKASVGTPAVSNDDSRLVISATASTASRVVLARTDVPAINQTRAYYEVGLRLSNTLAYVNVSLWDTSTNDWVNISAQSGAWYYDYDSGSQQKGVLYASAAASTEYVLGFDLTTSSVTMYLYTGTGALLVDKYIATNRLVGGDLDEIRFELAGSSSNTVYVDYLYVLGQKPSDSSLDSTVALRTVRPDKEFEEERIDIDPTALALEASLRSELFGFDTPTVDRRMSERELISAMGATPTHEQRAAGRLVAKGYSDLRYSAETSLKEYIASAEGVDYDEVYLVDYYIDYMQMKVKIDSAVADNLANKFEAIAQPIVESFGGTLLEDSATSSLMYAGASASASNTSWYTYALFTPVLIVDAVKGLFDDPFGLGSAADAALDAYNDATKDLNDAYNNTLALYNDWLNTSNENYQQLESDFMAFVSMSNAQITQLSDNYEDAQDRFERTISSYYAYTAQQFEATNAIIARLLLQNELYANGTQQLNQYFAGELGRTNEVIMNLTSTLVSQLDAQSFWASVMSDGKVEAQPLTFSGIFGSNLEEIIILVVVGFLLLMTVVVLIVTFRRKKGGPTHSKA